MYKIDDAYGASTNPRVVPPAWDSQDTATSSNAVSPGCMPPPCRRDTTMCFEDAGTPLYAPPPPDTTSTAQPTPLDPHPVAGFDDAHRRYDVDHWSMAPAEDPSYDDEGSCPVAELAAVPPFTSISTTSSGAFHPLASEYYDMVSVSAVTAVPPSPHRPSLRRTTSTSPLGVAPDDDDDDRTTPVGRCDESAQERLARSGDRCAGHKSPPPPTPFKRPLSRIGTPQRFGTPQRASSGHLLSRQQTPGGGASLEANHNPFSQVRGAHAQMNLQDLHIDIGLVGRTGSAALLSGRQPHHARYNSLGDNEDATAGSSDRRGSTAASDDDGFRRRRVLGSDDADDDDAEDEGSSPLFPAKAQTPRQLLAHTAVAVFNQQYTVTAATGTGLTPTSQNSGMLFPRLTSSGGFGAMGIERTPPTAKHPSRVHSRVPSQDMDSVGPSVAPQQLPMALSPRGTFSLPPLPSRGVPRTSNSHPHSDPDDGQLPSFPLMSTSNELAEALSPDALADTACGRPPNSTGRPPVAQCIDFSECNDDDDTSRGEQHVHHQMNRDAMAAAALADSVQRLQLHRDRSHSPPPPTMGTALRDGRGSGGGVLSRIASAASKVEGFATTSTPRRATATASPTARTLVLSTDGDDASDEFLKRRASAVPLWGDAATSTSMDDGNSTLGRHFSSMSSTLTNSFSQPNAALAAAFGGALATAATVGTMSYEEREPGDRFREARFQFEHVDPVAGGLVYVPLHADANGTVWLAKHYVDGLPYAVKEVPGPMSSTVALEVECLTIGNEVGTLHGMRAADHITRYHTVHRVCAPSTPRGGAAAGGSSVVATTIQCEYFPRGNLGEEFAMRWHTSIQQLQQHIAASKLRHAVQNNHNGDAEGTATASPASSAYPGSVVPSPSHTEPLKRWLAREVLPDATELAAILQHTLMALDAIHSRGIVHGHPIPWNIFKVTNYHYKLGCFGAAARVPPSHGAPPQGWYPDGPCPPQYLPPPHVRATMTPYQLDVFVVAAAVVDWVQTSCQRLRRYWAAIDGTEHMPPTSRDLLEYSITSFASSTALGPSPLHGFRACDLAASGPLGDHLHPYDEAPIGVALEHMLRGTATIAELLGPHYLDAPSPDVFHIQCAYDRELMAMLAKVEQLKAKKASMARKVKRDDSLPSDAGGGGTSEGCTGAEQEPQLPRVDSTLSDSCGELPTKGRRSDPTTSACGRSSSFGAPPSCRPPFSYSTDASPQTSPGLRPCPAAAAGRFRSLPLPPSAATTALLFGTPAPTPAAGAFSSSSASGLHSSGLPAAPRSSTQGSSTASTPRSSTFASTVSQFQAAHVQTNPTSSIRRQPQPTVATGKPPQLSSPPPCYLAACPSPQSSSVHSHAVVVAPNCLQQAPAKAAQCSDSNLATLPPQQHPRALLLHNAIRASSTLARVAPPLDSQQTPLLPSRLHFDDDEDEQVQTPPLDGYPSDATQLLRRSSLRYANEEDPVRAWQPSLQSQHPHPAPFAHRAPEQTTGHAHDALAPPPGPATSSLAPTTQTVVMHSTTVRNVLALRGKPHHGPVHPPLLLSATNIL